MANNFTSTLASLSEQDAKLEEMQLNQQLGLVIPRTVLTEQIPNWQRLFALLRLMYKSRLIDAGRVGEYLSDFEAIPDQEKDEMLTILGNMVAERIADLELLQEVYVSGQFQNEIRRVIVNLPSSIQQEVLDYISFGSNVPTTLNQRLQDQLHNMGEDEVIMKLQNALDRRRTLDTRKLGSTMSPTEIVDRFKLDETTPTVSTTSESAQTQAVPSKPPINPNSANNSTVSAKPSSIRPGFNRPTAPQPTSASAVANKYTHKPKGIGDLLSNKDNVK